MEVFKLTGSVLGGLGYFLLAVGMMTDGFKLAAAPPGRAALVDGALRFRVAGKRWLYAPKFAHWVAFLLMPASLS